MPDIARQTCGPDPSGYVKSIVKYAEAGYDHVCVHQVGPDQEGFLRFFRDEVMPSLGSIEASSARGSARRR